MFYIGPAPQHYRCFTLLQKDTHAIAVSDTVCFRHLMLMAPTLTTEDHIIHNLCALTNAIKGAPNATADDQLRAITQL